MTALISNRFILPDLYFLCFADGVLTFSGNHTHSDHFKLLREDGESVLIGAR